MPETWLGAAGCASGNQLCTGINPAFVPKPINESKNIIAEARNFVDSTNVGPTKMRLF